jgi:hypothetical protein
MPDPTDTGDSDEDDESPAAPKSLMERLFSAAPTVPDAPALDRNGNPTKWSIDRLDGRERVYAYVAAIMAAVFAVIIFVEQHHTSGHPHAKGQLSPTTSLLLGMASAIALAVTTRIGRRALVGFVALFAFLSFGTVSTIIGLPFMILAVWLLYRSYKVQKAATAKLREDRAAGKTTAAAPRPTRAEAAADRRAGRNGKKGPSQPEANKRYTPKKPAPPPRPAPKPTRRERRAAEAAD